MILVIWSIYRNPELWTLQVRNVRRFKEETESAGKDLLENVFPSAGFRNELKYIEVKRDPKIIVDDMNENGNNAILPEHCTGFLFCRRVPFAKVLLGVIEGGTLNPPFQMLRPKRHRTTKTDGHARSSKKGSQVRSSKKDGRASTTKKDGPVNDLLPELISEILSRLPIELILRCRSVCKTWNSVIQSPLFINLQARKSHNQPSRVILKPIFGGVTATTMHSLFLLDTEERKSRRIHDKSWRFSGLQIMSSCNGLLCITSDSELGPVYISNPITREFVILPSPETGFSLLRHQVGLGFDSSNGKYIVVRAYTDKSKSQVNKFEAIMLGENSWRSLTVPDIIAECTINGSVFWNGALHWKIKKKPGRECMLSFDVSSGKFAVTRFPVSADVPDDFEMVELDGHLSLVQVYDTQMKIWRVTGEKIEGLSVCYEDMYCMNVRWNSSFNCEIIRGYIDEGYLLQVNTHRGPGGAWRRYLTQYFPKMEQFLSLIIPSIPICFKTISFRPTLISPMQLHFVPHG
uniref:F-box domain-containing protein n=2 Tax=Vitis vinifera TaxID=29760 RepID=F6GTE4_VITVI